MVEFVRLGSRTHIQSRRLRQRSWIGFWIGGDSGREDDPLIENFFLVCLCSLVVSVSVSVYYSVRARLHYTEAVLR